MKRIFILVFVLAAVTVGFGQKSVDDLQPAHAAELQRYLKANPSIGFLQEHVIDDETLAYMRKEIRRGMMPFYLAADFNRDGRKDFAVLLSRNGGAPIHFPTEEEAAARADDRKLVLVVFNAKKRGFDVAHTERIEAPLTCFINLSDGRKPKLYFGVYQSDADTFTLAPAGKGYIMEFDKSP